MIDLHIHTTASDGVYSPEKVVEMASETHIEAISVTDHDTLEGVRLLIEKRINSGPELLTGVEISTQPPAEFMLKDSLHLLGYRVDPFNKSLNKELIRLQDARKNRNPEIIKKLVSLGIEVSMSELESFSGDVQIGRAHIGRLLFEKKYVSSVDEAFKTLLGKDKPAYVEKYKIPVIKAIRIVKEAGGVPVIAHPGLIKNMDENGFSDFFKFLKDAGLEGIEVLYPSHSERFRSFLKNECKRLDFIATGGSDFHGYKNEGLVIGRGRNNINVPFSVYEAILKR